MRVDWAIPCRYAEVNGGLATVVGAQVDAVRFDADADGTHTFELYVDGRHQQTLPFSIRS